MKINLSWLKRYVDIEEDPETLAADLTMFGLNVEKVEWETPAFKGVLFGKVVEVKSHPNADNLSVCKVDVGEEDLLNIVCGAPNVRDGLSVPVAVNGAVLPGSFKIKKTKLRGEVSEGMICSQEELRIGHDSSGIMELDFELPCGSDLTWKLAESEVILDIEVTPNRPDQLSYIGIAREIAAMYGRELNLPEVMNLQPGGDFKIEIENMDDCPRYSAALIDNVKIEDSPEWMRKYLVSVGINPINNIVDITNFVLMEMGQPLHAFDRGTFTEEAILVRRAVNGEGIKTLDGLDRKLKSFNLVITDGVNPLAVAGVMGGEGTEISGGTVSVLLESAVFNPKLIRQSRRELGLDTEASYRFERGSDIGITVDALGRACGLIEEFKAGNVRKLYSDVVEATVTRYRSQISVRREEVNRIMGTNLSAEEIVNHLEKLQLRSAAKNELISVSVPTYRLDLDDEIDIIEEIARVYGYDNIKGEGTGLMNTFPNVDVIDKRNEYLCSYLASRGYAEVITSSFISNEDLELFEWSSQGGQSDHVKILNPLTVSQSALRTSLIPGLLSVVAANPVSERKGIRIFEMGKVFSRLESGEGLPSENFHLAAVFTRNALPKQWISDERKFDFFDMKGELESILSIFFDLEDIRMARKEEVPQGHIFQWYKKNQLLAECGKIPDETARKRDIDPHVFFFAVYLDNFEKDASSGKRYSSYSPYPAVKRDLCVVTEERVTFSEIKSVIFKNSKYLEDILLFDYYKDARDGKDKRSYTFTLSFRSEESTLKDKKIDKIIQKILMALESQLKVFLRKE